MRASRTRSYSPTMRFVALAVCTALAFWIPAVLKFGTLSTVFACDYSECRPGDDGQMTNITADGWFTIPARDATPENARRIAHLTCGFQHVDDLARVLSVRVLVAGAVPPTTTRATPEAVARRYAELSGGRSTVYHGCLQGFGDRA